MNNDIKKLIKFIKLDENYSSKKITTFRYDDSEFYINLDFTYIDIRYREVEVNKKTIHYFVLSFEEYRNKEVTLYDEEFDNIEEIKTFLLENKEIFFQIDNQFSKIRKLVNKIGD